MNKTIKSLTLGLIIGLAITFSFIAFAGLTGPSSSGSPTVPGALCKVDGDTWQFCNILDTFGDTTYPIANGEFTALSVETLSAGTVAISAAVPGGLTVTGASDVTQLTVVGYATQTDDLILFEQSDGTDCFVVENDGTATAVNIVASGGIFKSATDIVIDANGGVTDTTVTITNIGSGVASLIVEGELTVGATSTLDTLTVGHTTSTGHINIASGMNYKINGNPLNFSDLVTDDEDIAEAKINIASAPTNGYVLGINWSGNLDYIATTSWATTYTASGGIAIVGDDIQPDSGFEIPLSVSTTDWEATDTWKQAAIDASDRLKMAYGGTEADLSSIATGGLMVGNGAGSLGVLNVGGANGYILMVDSGEGEGMKWGDATTTYDYWETQQTARTVDDLSDDDMDALSDVETMTLVTGDLLYVDGSGNWQRLASSTEDYILTISATGYPNWEAAGAGDVTKVGDCADGDCFDGTSDGGTYLSFYDAQGLTKLMVGDNTSSITLTLPTATGTLVYEGGTGGIDWTAGSAGTIHTDNYVENYTHTGEVTGATALTIADSISVTGWVLGTSTASTPAADDNDTSLATSAYVQTEINALGGTGLTCSAGSCNVDLGTSIATGEIDNDTITHANIADADQADTKCIWFEDPTADDDFKSIWANKTANDFLFTEIWGESDQTVSFDLQIDDGSPVDVSGTDIAPAAGEAEDTSLAGDTTLAAGEELDLIITSVTNTPTWVSICWTGNWVD